MLWVGVGGVCESPGLQNQPEKCCVTIPNVATFTTAQRAEGQLTAAEGSVTAEPRTKWSGRIAKLGTLVEGAVHQWFLIL